MQGIVLFFKKMRRKERKGSEINEPEPPSAEAGGGSGSRLKPPKVRLLLQSYNAPAFDGRYCASF